MACFPAWCYMVVAEHLRGRAYDVMLFHQPQSNESYQPETETSKTMWLLHKLIISGICCSNQNLINAVLARVPELA